MNFGCEIVCFDRETNVVVSDQHPNKVVKAFVDRPGGRRSSIDVTALYATNKAALATLVDLANRAMADAYQAGEDKAKARIRSALGIAH